LFILQFSFEGVDDPRPRDVVDICSILDTGCNLSAHKELLLAVFDAKAVPLAWVKDLDAYREFHRQGWEAVAAELGANTQPFDVYFARILELIGELEATGVV